MSAIPTHPEHEDRKIMQSMEDVMTEAMELGRRHIPEGKCADYIPELGHADPARLGLSIYTRSGERWSLGDTDKRFTIQSISKVISLAVALEVVGFDRVFDRVGMEPSGDAFNSLVKLDLDSSHPFNPFINSGALAVASYLMPEVPFDEMLDYVRNVCLDPGIRIDQSVYESESNNTSRNRAIAYLLQSKGIIDSDVEKSLDFYIKMCSLSVTSDSLANLGLVLAMDGRHPITGIRLLNSEVVRTVKTLMLTCGMYDGSGSFAVRVGVPSKSGVGGGILSVVNHRMGIGIYGPALDEKGNSIAGRYILEHLSEVLHLHVFARGVV